MQPKKFKDDPKFWNLKAGNNPQTSDMYVTRFAWPDIDKEIDDFNRQRWDEYEKRGDPGEPVPHPRLKPSSLFSCWKLSPEELAYLNEHGGEIWLGVMTARSGTQPPVVLVVGAPGDHGFIQLDMHGKPFGEAPPEK